MTDAFSFKCEGCDFCSLSAIRSTWQLHDGMWNNSETVMDVFHVEILHYVTNNLKYSQSVDGNM
jgi:hypothetical protein